jgi:hypothetical protein
LACPCKPGETPIWQTIANAPCGWSENQSSASCPQFDGMAQNIDGVSFIYHCTQVYSSSGPIAVSASSVFDCGRHCAARSDCRAANFAKGGNCYLHTVDGSLQPMEAEFIGALVRVSTSSGLAGGDRLRGQQDICPEMNDQRVFVGTEPYQILCGRSMTPACDKKLDAATAHECAEKCSQDSQCGATEWNHSSKKCNLHYHGRTQLTSSSNYHVLKKLFPSAGTQEPSGASTFSHPLISIF